jgi:hypothetical protein
MLYIVHLSGVYGNESDLNNYERKIFWMIEEISDSFPRDRADVQEGD